MAITGLFPSFIMVISPRMSSRACSTSLQASIRFLIIRARLGLTVFSRPEPYFLVLWLVAAVTALLTSLYTFRLLYLVLAGEPRHDAHPHAPGWLMVWPLVPLAVLGVLGGVFNLPAIIGGGVMLSSWYAETAAYHVSHAQEWLLWLLAVVLFGAGWAGAHWRYGRTVPLPLENGFSRFLLSGWQADALVERLVLVPYRWVVRFCCFGLDGALIDGLLAEAGKSCLRVSESLRALVTGRVSTYLGAFAWGLLLLLCWAAVRSLLYGGGGH